MAQTVLRQDSFSRGELAPNLFGRVDESWYKLGAATMRNWFVDFRGGASNRAGTKYIATSYVPTAQPRLYPFVVGQGDAYLLEIGNQYINIYQSGVAVLMSPIVTTYLQADLQSLKFSQSADVLTITHPSYPPANLTLKASVWTLAAIVVGPEQSPPGTLTVTPPSTTDPDYCYCYVVTAVSADGKNESLPCSPKLAHYTILDETQGFVLPMSWVPSASPVSLYRIYKCGPYDDRDATGPGTLFGYIGSAQTATFVDINIAPDFTQTPPQFGDPFSPGQFASIAVSGGGSGYPSGAAWTGYVALLITDSTGSGAAGFATTSFAGVVTGVYLTAPGKNYTAPVISAAAGGATFTYTLTSVGPANPLYPVANCYYQQRSVFGGSTPKPETLSLSQIGDYTNFNVSPISQASDALVVDIASTQVNTIQAFQPVSYGLMIFTVGGNFLLNGGSQGAALTPASVTITAQASNGANALPPIQVNFSIIYMQNRGNIVRDLSFVWQRQSYAAADISTWSNHLFQNHTFTEWTYADVPFKLVYAIRSDGVLLSMAYVPDQEVFGWSRHDTQGLFCSVASLPEGNVNATYVVVRRYVPANGDALCGDGWFYYIERLDDRQFDCVEEAWFLDSALAYQKTYPDFTLYQTGTGLGNVVELCSPC